MSHGFRSALGHRDFRQLTLSHGLATVGQLVLTLSVGVHVLDRTGSGLWVSVTVALAFAPYAVFSSLAGVLADRVSRSRVLAWSAGVRAGLALAVGTGILLELPVAVVVVSTALLATAATPSYPALTAATPECVGDEELPAANALVTCVENVTWMAGPGVFGVLAMLGLGPGAVVLAAAGVLALAAVEASQVGLPRPTSPGVGSGWWAELASGIQAVTARPGVWQPLLLAVLGNFLYGYLVVALVLVADQADIGHARLGWLNAALTAGALGSMPVVGRLVRGARAAVVLPIALGGFCVSVVAVGILGPTLPGIAMVAVAGGATLMAEVAAVTLLQRSAGKATLARVFGVYDQLNVGAIAVGSLLAGPLAVAWGPGRAVVVTGGVCLLLALAATVSDPRVRALGFSPWPATSSSFPLSTSRADGRSSSSKGSPAPRRPSATLSRLR